MSTPYDGVAEARFLLPAAVSAAPIVVGRGSPIVEGGYDAVVVVASWDPSQLLSYRRAAGVVILARSPRNHAVMAALELCIPCCVVDPDAWPKAPLAWVQLNPGEGLVAWILAEG